MHFFFPVNVHPKFFKRLTISLVNPTPWELGLFENRLWLSSLSCWVFFFFFFFQMSLGPKGRGEVRNTPHLMRRESWSSTNCANLGLIAIFFFSTSNYLYSSVCPTVTLTRNNHRGLFTRSLWKKTLWSSPRRLCSKRRIIMDSQQTQNQPLSTRRLHNSISIKILSCPCSLTKLVNFR